MAEIHALPFSIGVGGADRLQASLRAILAAGADLGPRWPQIRSLGGSLRQLSRDLEGEIGCLAVAPGSSTLEIEALRDSLYRLADAISRLGSLAQDYPS